MRPDKDSYQKAIMYIFGAKDFDEATNLMLLDNDLRKTLSEKKPEAAFSAESVIAEELAQEGYSLHLSPEEQGALKEATEISEEALPTEGKDTDFVVGNPEYQSFATAVASFASSSMLGVHNVQHELSAVKLGYFLAAAANYMVSVSELQHQYNVQEVNENQRQKIQQRTFWNTLAMTTPFAVIGALMSTAGALTINTAALGTVGALVSFATSAIIPGPNTPESLARTQAIKTDLEVFFSFFRFLFFSFTIFLTTKGIQKNHGRAQHCLPRISQGCRV